MKKETITLMTFAVVTVLTMFALYCVSGKVDSKYFVSFVVFFVGYTLSSQIGKLKKK